MSLKNLDNLSPPPRRVPLPVRCHQRFGGLSQIGWWLAAFFTPFFWLFFMDCEVITWLRFARSLATCPGVVTSIEHTSSSEGEQTVIGNRYTFTVDGKQFSGCSYSTGSNLTKGNPITVEYATSNPAVSRIQGYRAAKFGGGGWLILLFVAIPVALLKFAWSRSSKALRLLEHGIPGEAVFKEKVPTNSSVNDELVYELKYEFTAADGKIYSVSMRETDTEKYEKEGFAQVLHDPADPSCAMLADDLPAPPRIDRDGNLHPISSRRALLVSIVPLVTIAWNALWLWHWLFK